MARKKVGVVERGPRGESNVDAEQVRLLKEVLEKPEDDAPRLVYADFLQERGDPRGEFIALQISKPDDPRVGELLKKHKKKWIGRFAGTKTRYGSEGQFTKGTPTKWEFARGFVDRVAMDSSDLIANSKELFAIEPVREIRITDRDVTSLVRKCAGLERVRSVDLAKIVLSEEASKALFGSKRFERLERLDLRGGRLSMLAWRKGLAAFDPSRFPRLRHLDLSENHLGDPMVLALAASPLLGLLRELDLRATETTAKGIAALAPASLEMLDLRADPVGDEGVRLLTRMRTLRDLRVPYTDARDSLLDLLALPALERLEIDDEVPEEIPKLRARLGEGLEVG